MSISNCCFLTCIQISQEADQVVWYSHLLKNFPQFIVIHTVKGFGTLVIFKTTFESEKHKSLSTVWYVELNNTNYCKNNWILLIIDCMLDTVLKCLHVLTHLILITALWVSIIRWGPGNGYGGITCPDSSHWQAGEQGFTSQRLCFYRLHSATSAKVAKSQVILYFLILCPCIIFTTSNRQKDNFLLSSSSSHPFIRVKSSSAGGHYAFLSAQILH